MNQIIGELIGNIIPFGLFLYLTLIVFGIVKTKNKPSLLENPSILIKISLVVVTLIFGILIALSFIPIPESN